MRTTLLTFLLLTLPLTFIFAQEKKIQIGLEYSLAASSITDPDPYQKLKASYNTFFKLEFPLSTTLSITSGIGYMHTGERIKIDTESLLFDIQVPGYEDSDINIKTSKGNFNYTYISIPVGIKARFGNFFINPEIGISQYLSNIRRTNYILENGENIESKSKNPIDPDRKFALPVFTSIGWEVPLSNFRLTTGLKGYYSILGKDRTGNQNGSHYGLGLLVGIGF